MEREMQWQPIETAPKDGTHILIYTVDHPGPVPARDMPARVTAFWYAPYGEWHLVMAWGYEAENQVYGVPTHWQPLPDPPKPALTLDIEKAPAG